MFITQSVRQTLLGLLVVAAVGCGSAEQGSLDTSMLPSDEAASESRGPEPAASDSGQTAAADAGDRSPAEKQTRRIIYTTTLSLVVEDYQDFEKQITLLVDQHDGFVAHSETSRRFSDRQSGTWTVRVPVDRYTPFLTSVTALGFAEARKENAQDVTEEFFDIEARIKNKRELERRVIAMLEERTGKLADVLEMRSRHFRTANLLLMRSISRFPSRNHPAGQKCDRGGRVSGSSDIKR